MYPTFPSILCCLDFFHIYCPATRPQLVLPIAYATVQLHTAGFFHLTLLFIHLHFYLFDVKLLYLLLLINITFHTVNSLPKLSFYSTLTNALPWKECNEPGTLKLRTTQRKQACTNSISLFINLQGKFKWRNIEVEVEETFSGIVSTFRKLHHDAIS